MSYDQILKDSNSQGFKFSIAWRNSTIGRKLPRYTKCLKSGSIFRNMGTKITIFILLKVFYIPVLIMKIFPDEKDHILYYKSL